MGEPFRLADRYELRKVLGRGGMAEVHLAYDARLGREVAVKTLLPELARDPVFLGRFHREAQSAASLNHPAIVAVYDTGENEAGGVTAPYIVMEYVEGATLREALQAGGPPSPQWALEMCAGVLRALDYAHGHGIVHRDIKPANVMLTDAGQVKVMDFGIARAMGEVGMTMTQTSTVIGTAHYFSPEQARGEKVDTRSDLYSTGCLLYELLTARPPFTGDSPVSVAYQHVSEEPPPPSVHAPGIAPDIDAIVLKSLAKERDYRYQSAGEMLADIEAALRGGPVAAVDRPTTALRPGPAPEPVGPRTRPERRAGRRRRGSKAPVILTGLLTVALLAGAVLGGRLLLDDGGDGGADEVETLTVPNMGGMTEAQAQEVAAQAGFTIAEGGSKSCAEDEGTVCETSPAAGEEIDQGQTVTLIMSSGSEPIEVPDVTGDPFQEALTELQDAGFRVAQETEEDADAEPGTVLEQDPGGGEEATPGDTITLTVAAEPETPADPTPDPDPTDGPDEPTDPLTVAVPDVTGRPYDEAEQTLTDAGFAVWWQEAAESTGATPGTVITQDPAGGLLEPGGVVTLTVEPAPVGIEIPDVSGLTYDQAHSIIQGAGFRPLPSSYPDPDLGCQPHDTIGYTVPAAGETAAEGESVYLNCYRPNG
ncbi:Stk1 family PASTA domain-containing Ser/Thr kinase [Streptomyces litchfieldiae]|uniref:non-specific serine/threonine protein kinase n=1 Tax=Streptomyces litchfieldiae TaxID=3075543 RepID=A0ABU2MT62_9ACTN|nr:Stk1 family PASTA domain-containing Ser/Thr kinase [Streptomyces sp. DSM 44938]MDT0344826.1 Stk1 family PASTA domain-containing Ser/Thr kinase [Streptomyces sp. DSM 44938]